MSELLQDLKGLAESCTDNTGPSNKYIPIDYLRADCFNKEALNLIISATEDEEQYCIREMDIYMTQYPVINELLKDAPSKSSFPMIRMFRNYWWAIHYEFPES